MVINEDNNPHMRIYKGITKIQGGHKFLRGTRHSAKGDPEGQASSKEPPSKDTDRTITVPAAATRNTEQVQGGATSETTDPREKSDREYKEQSRVFQFRKDENGAIAIAACWQRADPPVHAETNFSQQLNEAGQQNPESQKEITGNGQGATTEPTTREQLFRTQQATPEEVLQEILETYEALRKESRCGAKEKWGFFHFTQRHS